MHSKTWLSIVYVLVLIMLLWSLSAKADTNNRLKHGLIAAGISGGISAYCNYKLKNSWFCLWGGIIPTVIGSALFEAIQEDYSDMEQDMISNGTGAVIGSVIAISF